MSEHLQHSSENTLTQTPSALRHDEPHLQNGWWKKEWGKWLIALGIILLIIAMAVAQEAWRRQIRVQDITWEDIELNFSRVPVSEVSPPIDSRISVELYEGATAEFGPKDAPVQIVAFVDFQCPFCARQAEIIKDWQSVYRNNVRYVFRHFPVSSIHPDAIAASEASLCANDQGKFWQYHDALFLNRDDLSTPSLKRIARSLSLDGAAFDSCLDGRFHRLKVQEDYQLGLDAGVRGTPTYFINGIKRAGAIPRPIWDQIIAIVRATANK